jgi:hypothetical protein
MISLLLQIVTNNEELQSYAVTKLWKIMKDVGADLCPALIKTGTNSYPNLHLHPYLYPLPFTLHSYPYTLPLPLPLPFTTTLSPFIYPLSFIYPLLFTNTLNLYP